MPSNFPYFFTPSFSTSSGKLALGDGETNPQTGHVDHGCLKRYFFSGPYSHPGRQLTDEYPKPIKHAATRKRIEGEDSVIGNIAHDHLEDSLFALADSLKGRPGVPTAEEMLRQKLQRFERVYDESLHFDEQEFAQQLRARSSGAPSPIWLQKHAKRVLDSRPIDLDDDRRTRQKYREKLTATCTFISEHLSEMIQHTPYQRWSVLEGKELVDGDVVCAFDEEQSVARARHLKPSFEINVDGMQVRVFCTIDFAYWLPDDRLVIADLKTGKVKPAHFDQTGLYGFYICDTHPEIDPDRITFRLIYPSADDPYREVPFSAAKLEETQKITRERIRKMMGCFIALDDPRIENYDSFNALRELYPEDHVRSIWTLGSFRRTGVWPTSLPAAEGLKRNSVPTPLEVFEFLKINLSPYEMARGLMNVDQLAMGIAEQALDRVAARTGLTTAKKNEIVNDYVLNLLVPTLSLEDFFRQYSVGHIKIALPQLFPATGAENTPEYCDNCAFYRLCEEGQATSESGRRRY